MKRTYKRQRLRMFWLIFTSVLVTCVAAIAAYTVIVYNNAKQDLIYSSETECMAIRDTAEEYDSGILTYAANYFVNASVPVPTSSDCRYIEIKDIGDGSTLAQTSNTFTGEFAAAEDEVAYKETTGVYDEDGSLVDGVTISKFSGNVYVDYDSFRASMTDEQYDKIREYLQSAPEEEDMYYELVCTRFYKSDASCEVMPKTVEIVKTCDDYTWYAQTKPVESFELTPEASSDATLYKTGEMHINLIDTDFVLGNRLYDYSEIKKEAKKILNAGTPTDDDDNCCVEQTGAFTYMFVDEQSFTCFQLYVSSNDSGDHTYSYVTNAELIYARQFNVLDTCIDNIIWAALIIFSFFVVMGAVLEFAVIHTFNSRVRQEQKRIEMTNAFAHNMKTPIQVITGFAENMERKIKTDEAHRYTEVIKRQAFSMDKLVHRMLDYTHLDSGSVKPNKTEFALCGLVEEIINTDGFAEREFTLELEPSVTINADRGLLRLALENLIENAVKYSPAGSVIKISGSRGRLEISNACEGIAKADLKKLWQPYFRLNRNSEKGSGIGLSIVSSVMKLHKFPFGAETQNDVITFYFEF